MRIVPRVALVVWGALSLAACDTVRDVVGRQKNPPDEFAVYSRAPLSLPPDYGLRPPIPGAVRPHEIEPRRDAERALTGAVGTGGRAPSPAIAATSPGTQALLRDLGALGADPSIRAVVNRESTIFAEEDQTFTEKIMFWSKPAEQGTVVDAERESRRIRENQALGRPLTEGETPSIARKRRALLEGLFK